MDQAKQKGFTLIEIIVAIAIFGMLSIAMLSLYLHSIRMTNHAGRTDRAVAEISGELDEALAGGETESTDSTVTVTFQNDTITDTLPVQKITKTQTTSDGRTVEMSVVRPVVSVEEEP